ncbi:hypothetical protein PQ610_03105 [Tardisphaera miroshnichenkoae]
MLNGMHVSLFGSNFIYPLEITYLIAAYAVISALVPMFWKNKYSLYASFVIAFLSLTLVVDSIIFRYKYLVSKGAYVVPTPTGYIYFQSSTSLRFGFPFWLLLALLVLSEVNITTKASWARKIRKRPLEKVSINLQKGPIEAVLTGLRELGIPYEYKGDLVKFDGIEVYLGSPRELKGDEAFAFQPEGGALHLTAMSQEHMETRDAVMSALASAVKSWEGTVENEYERERSASGRAAHNLDLDEYWLLRRYHDLRR